MTSFFEKAVRFMAIAVLAFEMPVPIYWLTLHGWVSFWRRHIRAAFPVVVLAAWGIVDGLLYRFRQELFRPRRIRLRTIRVGRGIMDLFEVDKV